MYRRHPAGRFQIPQTLRRPWLMKPRINHGFSKIVHRHSSIVHFLAVFEKFIWFVITRIGGENQKNLDIFQNFCYDQRHIGVKEH